MTPILGACSIVATYSSGLKSLLKVYFAGPLKKQVKNGCSVRFSVLAADMWPSVAQCGAACRRKRMVMGGLWSALDLKCAAAVCFAFKAKNLFILSFFFSPFHFRMESRGPGRRAISLIKPFPSQFAKWILRKSSSDSSLVTSRAFRMARLEL